ncbi:MAG: hypothetical protein U0133_02390 [Gemmatimonadales bacterium]
MRMLAVLSLLPFLAAPVPLAGQEVTGAPGPRRLLPPAEEIALARSAAPPSVSATARIWIFAAGRYTIGDSGTSTVECYVGRSWPRALEPQCFDAEGARTILPLERRISELLHSGASRDSVERHVAAGLAAGTFQLPRRPAMTWMLSAAQELYDDDGSPAGAWKPHIMIYYPYLTPDAVGTGSNDDLAAGLVVSPGTPRSSFMIVVPDAIVPVRAATGKRGAS